MPIYTYRCENCGVQFDRHQKFEDKPLRRCPECNKKTLRKVIGPVGIAFKGSGFYATDNRSASGARSRAGGDKTEKAEKHASSQSPERSEGAAEGSAAAAVAAPALSKPETGAGTEAKKSD